MRYTSKIRQFAPTLFSFLIISVFAVSCYGATYKETIEKAEKSGKDILIVGMAIWCQPCKSFHSNTLGNKQVKERLADFEFYELNIDRENNLATKYGFSTIPQYIVVDSKEKVLKRGVGNVGVGEFLNWLPKKMNND